MEQKLHKQTPAMKIQKAKGVMEDLNSHNNHGLSLKKKIDDREQFSHLDMQSTTLLYDILSIIRMGVLS